MRISAVVPFKSFNAQPAVESLWSAAGQPFPGLPGALGSAREGVVPVAQLCCGGTDGADNPQTDERGCVPPNTT